MEAISPSITLDETPRSGLAEALSKVLEKAKSSMVSLSYSALGMATLIGLWALTSYVTNYEIPTPLATWVVFRDLLADPFYDLGPNEKGIGLDRVAKRSSRA